MSQSHEVMLKRGGGWTSLFDALGDMRRVVGVLLLVILLYGLLAYVDAKAISVGNLRDLAQRQALFGLLSLGVGILIISGGIDLSMGSVVGLSAVSFALVLKGVSIRLLGIELSLPQKPVAAALVVLAGTALIGLIHGLLVTKVRLQPFLVTLCGLFIYRGLAKQLSARSVGLGEVREVHRGDEGFLRELEQLQFLSTGKILGIPTIFILMLVIAALLGLVLHGSIYGRYLFAIGHNEQAARYAGISTDRYKIFAYMLCSVMAGLGGILLILEVETAAPPTIGSLYELYAITGAVLGGCSLRGGEGTVVGMLLGAAVLPILRNLIIFARFSDAAEYTIIGFALLLGTTVDELLNRRVFQRLVARLKDLLRQPASRGP